MKTQITTDEALRWRRIHGFAVLALLLFFMVCPVAPERWNDLYISYGKAAILALAGIYFYKRGLGGTVEIKLVLWYTIWMFISRLLNTDYYLQNELELVISRVLCFIVLPTGLILEPRERELLLDVLIAVSGAYYLFTALLGLFTCVFGIYIYLPPENVVFGLDDNYLLDTFYYIFAWHTNRTISSVWFYIAWCMMIYEFFHCKNRLWRIPIVFSGFVFYLAIAFCFCRSIKLAVCANIVMLVILWAVKSVRLNRSKPKMALICLLVVLSLPLTYKSFDVLTSATAAAYNALDTDIERTSDRFMMGTFSEDTQNGQTFEDGRNLKKSISNMSNRGNIFASIIPTLREDPGRLLIGKYSMKLMEIPNRYQNYNYFHMHNYLIQVLMLTGLPGFLLVLAFSVLLVIKMIRLFFSPAATTAVKTLTLPLTGIFIYGMFEIVIFTNCADQRSPTDFRELFFFLIAGMMLAYCEETLPERKRNRKDGISK